MFVPSGRANNPEKQFLRKSRLVQAPRSVFVSYAWARMNHGSPYFQTLALGESRRRSAVVWCLALGVSIAACEPDAFLGSDTQDAVSLGAAGGHDSTDTAASEAPLDSDSLVIEETGSAGASNPADDTTWIQGHECSVVEPGESHEELTAVCCAMNAVESDWRDEAIAELNVARLDLGLPPFQRDPALDEAAMAWAMHWHLHWDPIAKAGYPTDYTAPTEVSAACGTTAHTLVMTNAQGETRLSNGLIEPSFPAQAWQNSRNFDFEDPRYLTVGIGFYDGLLLGLFDRD